MYIFLILLSTLLFTFTYKTTLFKTELNSLIESKIRPFLQNDGGDLIIKKIEFSNENENQKDLKVEVELIGNCETCPASSQTMKSGIEKIIKEEFSSRFRKIEVFQSFEKLNLENLKQFLDEEIRIFVDDKKNDDKKQSKIEVRLKKNSVLFLLRKPLSKIQSIRVSLVKKFRKRFGNFDIQFLNI